MNAKSIDDLRIAVRERGDYRNERRFPNSAVNREIQAAFAEFYGIVESANEGYFDTTGLLSTIAGQDFVALPSGTWKVRAIDLLDGGRFVPMARAGVKDRNRYGGTLDKPRAYRLVARGADLLPTPNAIYTLRLTYTPAAPELDSTPREFYNGWEEYAIFGAMLRLGGTERNEAPTWQAALNATAERIRREAPERGAQEPEYLNLYDGGDCLDRPPDWSW